MDFKQFEYVMVVNEEKSISKAARRLFISQPSLSQYIGRIEAELGVALFDRATSPISLTYEGEIYLEAAKKILLLTDEMKRNFSDVNNLKIGRLRIGVTPSKANDPLPTILPAFRQKYPGIELYLTEASSDHLEELLTKNLIDICMMNLPPSKNKSIDSHTRILQERQKAIAYEKICDEEIFLAAPPNVTLQHIQAEGAIELTDPSELSGKEFILLHSDQRLRHIAENFFLRNKISPKILLETRGIETALRLCGEGMGFTFVPNAYISYSTAYNKPSYYRIGSNGLAWCLVFAYNENGYLSQAAKAFVEISKKIIISKHTG